MGYHLSERSKTRLIGVHPDLVKVVERAIEISSVDFAVLEGVRSLERQKVLLAAGASKTMNSRHLIGKDGFSHAVDLGAWVDGQVNWSWPLYHRIADAMKIAANELKIPIEWGGDWKTFKDGPHFQLPERTYK